MRKLSPTTRALSELLHDIGWENPCDAQLTGLDQAILDGRIAASMNAEPYLRDYLDAEQPE